MGNTISSLFTEDESVSEKAVYDALALDLRNALQRSGAINRVEYAGSQYKGTATAGSDYDVLFVKVDSSVKAITQHDGFAFLQREGKTSYMHPQSEVDKFKSQVEAALHGIQRGNNCHLRASTPTIVLTYDDPKNQIHFEADLVLSYEVSAWLGLSQSLYIARSPHGATGKDLQLWKESKSITEKDRMKTIDRDGGVGRRAVKILKNLKSRETNMSCLKSYFFEQVLMYVKDQYPDVSFWRENNMERIMSAMLHRIVESLEDGYLGAYYDPCNNTIEQLNQRTRDILSARFRTLAEDPQALLG